MSAEARAGGDLEILEITVAVERFEMPRLELLRDVSCGLLQLRRSRGAAFELVGGEVLDVVQIFSWTELGAKQAAGDGEVGDKGQPLPHGRGSVSGRERW